MILGNYLYDDCQFEIEDGHKELLLILGRLYTLGLGCPKSINLATDVFLKAGEEGFYLGFIEAGKLRLDIFDIRELKTAEAFFYKATERKDKNKVRAKDVDDDEEEIPDDLHLVDEHYFNDKVAYRSSSDPAFEAGQFWIEVVHRKMRVLNETYDWPSENGEWE